MMSASERFQQGGLHCLYLRAGDCTKAHIWEERRILCQEKTADSGTVPDRERVMNQKLENLLNLALETPETERIRTDNLNVGFDGKSRTWELIVKYHGRLTGLEALGVSVEYLINSYAILTVPEGLVEAVSNIEEIEYVEKPKRYYYQDISPAADSCMTQVTLRDPLLSGEGVLVAVLDSGERVIILSG